MSTKHTVLLTSLIILATFGCALDPGEEDLPAVPPGGSAAPSPIEVIGDQVVFEGDMVLGTVDEMGTDPTALEEQSAGVFDVSRGFQGGTGYFGGGEPWPNGKIRYKFANNVTGTRKEQFGAAARHWMDNTDIRLELATATDTSYVLIKMDMSCRGTAPASKPACGTYTTRATCNATGTGCGWEGDCNSHVGYRAGSVRTLQAGRADCGRDQLVHEIGHAVGLAHEHQRWDRGNYINPSNPGCTVNCTEAAKEDVAIYGTYDTDSVMHYTDYDTLAGTAVTPDVDLTSRDILGVQVAYGAAFQTPVSVVSPAAGKKIVTVRREDNLLWSRVYNNGAWGSWTKTSTSATLAGATSVATSAGEAYVFWRSESRALMAKKWANGSWGGVIALSGTLAGEPAVSVAGNRIDVIAKNANGSLSHTKATNGYWSGVWTSLAPAALGAVKAISTASGVTEVFMKDGNRNVYSFTYNGSGWSALTALGGPCLGTPEVVYGGGMTHLFCKGADSFIWRRTRNGTWQTWTKLSTTTAASNPVAVSTGYTEVYWQGSDGYLRRAMTGRGDWPADANAVSTVMLVGTPSVVMNGVGMSEVFVWNRDDNLVWTSNAAFGDYNGLRTFTTLDGSALSW